MSQTLTKTLQAALYQRFENLPGVHIELHNELLAVRVDNEAATATVFLQGAQLAHYQRHDEPPIIWCSPQCDYRKGDPLRGGVPVCWPWLGPLDKNAYAIKRQIPLDIAGANGLVRSRAWQLTAVEQPRPDLTRIILSLSLDEQQEAAWPMATALQLTISVSRRLQVNLDITNRTDYPFYFSAGLLSHYVVSDIDQVSVNGLERMNYVDLTRDWSYGNQRGPLLIDKEIDRIYHGTWQPLSLIDRGWHRELHISCEGSDNAVLWNPWAEKSRSLSQYPDQGYRDMLCIGTANADDDFVVLMPHRRRRLGFTVRCRPLS